MELSVSPQNTDTAPSASHPIKGKEEGASFLSRLKEKLRKRKVLKAIRILSQFGQPELLQMCREKAVELGVELSVKGVQQILQQQGITHCYRCPNRFGLRKLIGGLYICTPCYSTEQAKHEKASQ